MSNLTPFHQNDLQVPEWLASSTSHSGSPVNRAGDLDRSQMATTSDLHGYPPGFGQIRSYYLQAVAAGKAALITNLSTQTPPTVTAMGTNWLIRRNSGCAIVLPQASVSRLHANQQRLVTLKKWFLHEGDWMTLGSVSLRFVVSSWKSWEAGPQQSSVQDTVEVY